MPLQAQTWADPASLAWLPPSQLAWTPAALLTWPVAVPNGHYMALAWQGSGQTYNLYRSSVSGGETAPPIMTGITGQSVNDPNVVSGSTYYYTVTQVINGV